MGQGQTISPEAALPVFRQRCGELNDENLLLRARVNELEAELSRLQDAAQAPVPDETEATTSASNRVDERP